MEGNSEGGGAQPIGDRQRSVHQVPEGRLRMATCPPPATNIDTEVCQLGFEPVNLEWDPNPDREHRPDPLFTPSVGDRRPVAAAKGTVVEPG